jgi:hypothetical protein
MEKTMRLLITAAILALFATTAIAAEEKAVPVANRTGVAVTLYSGGFGLIKDRRTVDLGKGASSLAFEGVSARMIPSSALVRAGSGVRVLEQNFEFDLISPESLLRRSVGRQVRVIRTHPTTGEDWIETAQVLATENGTVLRIGDRIETGVPGRLVFDSIPTGLRAQPTLLLEVDSASAGSEELQLTYLSEGMNWRAEYALELDGTGESLDLSAWASLSNNSGVAFDGADLQLVAGDVQRERAFKMMAAMPMARGAVAEEAANSSMQQEAIGDLHLYSIPRPVTLKNKQTKQVAMMSAADVRVAREYIKERWIPERDFRVKAVTPLIERPTVYLSFENEKTNNLGIPLPAGLVRVYERDSANRIQFAGEHSISHKATGENVALNMGEASDIGVQYEQKDFKKDGLPEKTFESAQWIRVTNAKSKPVSVWVVESFPGVAEFLEKSIEPDEFTRLKASWEIEVPAGGETILTYRVRVRRLS